MKRLLSQQKTAVVVLGLVGLLFVASSFTFGPVEDAQLAGNDPQKKEQRVKVIVSVDGKQTKIDTVFNLPDEKMINEKVDSILGNLDHEGMSHHKGKRMILFNDGNMRFHNGAMNGKPGDEQFDIMVQRCDSGKMGKGRKVVCVQDFDNDQMDQEGDDELMPPPPPPMPPHHFMMHQRFGGDPFAFDTKDESIISYEKKDIGDGLEKITIVRKKHDQHKEIKEIRVKAEVSDNQMNKKKNDELKSLKKAKDEAANTKGPKE